MCYSIDSHPVSCAMQIVHRIIMINILSFTNNKTLQRILIPN